MTPRGGEPLAPTLAGVAGCLVKNLLDGDLCDHDVRRSAKIGQEGTVLREGLPRVKSREVPQLPSRAHLRNRQRRRRPAMNAILNGPPHTELIHAIDPLRADGARRGVDGRVERQPLGLHL